MADHHEYGIALYGQHAALLRESAISTAVAHARGYVSIGPDSKGRLADVGIARPGRSVPGLLIPIWGVDGTVRLHQYRPDTPRLNDKGKAQKYETPYRAAVVLDVPPGVRERLADPLVDLWVTEGSRKADAAVTAGLCCVALLGVWSWRGTNSAGGSTALACWESVALKGRNVFVAFDSDVMVKDEVRKALDRFAAFLASRGASVRLVHLPAGPDGAKVGLDDYLAAGNTTLGLQALARPPGERVDSVGAGEPEWTAPELPEPEVVTLDQAHAVFSRWLGDEFDLIALDAVLCTAAAQRLDGDPPWLLVVSGSGAAKTEIVAALGRSGAHVTSTISSEGALLSATSTRERARDATGGLLRRIGPRGLLVIKDFTSVISMSRDARAAVLAALREVHDGRWERNVGADGGRTLTWTGRIVLIGAVTTAYDAAHSVIAAMGDRFALVRIDSADAVTRRAAGRRALANVDHEKAMRTELADAAAGLLAGLDAARAVLTDEDQEELLGIADLVTLGRTAVERDNRGDVIDAHAPEMPTRLAKTLGQIVRGGLALGMDPVRARAVAVRVAGDSMPPLRLAVLGHLARHDASRTADVRRELKRPHNTVDRELQALHVIGLLAQGEAVVGRGWTWSLAGRVDRDALATLISRKVTTPTQTTRSGTDAVALLGEGCVVDDACLGSAIPGNSRADDWVMDAYERES